MYVACFARLQKATTSSRTTGRVLANPLKNAIDWLVLPTLGRLLGGERLGALDVSHAAQAGHQDEEEQEQRQQAGQDVGRHLDRARGRLRLEAAVGTRVRRQRPGQAQKKKNES